MHVQSHMCCMEYLCVCSQLFEISDVVLVDPKSDVGSVNERHISAVFSSNASGLEVCKAVTCLP